MSKSKCAEGKLKEAHTWSELCQRWFASKAEARRGEELLLLQRTGKIDSLNYQITFILCEQPQIRITVDFAYFAPDIKRWIYEDVKGVLTRDFRTKLAWLKQQKNIDVKLIQA